MLKKVFVIIIPAFLSVLLVACDIGNDEIKKVEVRHNTALKTIKESVSTGSNKRWYSTSQVIRGKQVFKDNCLVCHGEKAQGLVKDWKKADAEGKFPAPPLNGSAHAWHHSKEALLRTVNNGGIPLGGTMPGFKDKLSDTEKEAVLAYVMSLWSDEIYSAWKKRNP